MIDLEKRREQNRRRLMGLDANADSSVVPITRADVQEPEKAWEIISLCVRCGTTTDKNGKTRASKNLKFPELLESKVVGERATTTKNAKKNTITRTNIETMREMFQTRNAMSRHYEDDIDDKYVEYFKDVVEVLDTYAIEVVTDIIVEDEDFLNRVNKARGCEEPQK